MVEVSEHIVSLLVCFEFDQRASVHIVEKFDFDDAAIVREEVEQMVTRDNLLG